MNSCGVYSFSGTTLPAEVKTISIQTFPDVTGQGPPFLSQRFSEQVRNFFQTTTNLTLVKNNGDLQLSGTITGYRLEPVAITSNDLPAQNRLTITIQVNYVNTKEEDKDFEMSFSQFADFPATTAINNVETSLIEDIGQRLSVDIFNKTVADW